MRRQHAETITTSVGKTHVLNCPGRGPYPTAVLVHGVCSCAHDYYPLITRLQRLCKSVLVIDLPGTLQHTALRPWPFHENCTDYVCVTPRSIPPAACYG